jgi:hypothetical protein
MGLTGVELIAMRQGMLPVTIFMMHMQSRSAGQLSNGGQGDCYVSQRLQSALFLFFTKLALFYSASEHNMLLWLFIIMFIIIFHACSSCHAKRLGRSFKHAT